MKQQLILVLLFCAVLNGFAQQNDSTNGINFFQGTFKEAAAKAKAENKFIFLDAFASWCGPCKTMDKEVYANKKVGKYLNEKFISIKIDIEKGEGPEVAKRFHSIDGYPSLLFFSPEGHLAKTILGSRHIKNFLAEVKLVVE